MDNWYLCYKANKSFGKGFQVYQQAYRMDGSEYLKYGDYITFYKEDFTQVWKLSELNLEWQDLEIKHKVSLKERIKKFFNKDYQINETDIIRPKNKSVIIAEYGNGNHYEVVEYSHKSWVTELWFGVMPKRWAYIPCFENIE